MIPYQKKLVKQSRTTAQDKHPFGLTMVRWGLCFWENSSTNFCICFRWQYSRVVFTIYSVYGETRYYVSNSAAYLGPFILPRGIKVTDLGDTWWKESILPFCNTVCVAWRIINLHPWQGGHETYFGIICILLSITGWSTQQSAGMVQTDVQGNA